jgi:hypothetical protein
MRLSLAFSDGVSLGPGHCHVIVDPIPEAPNEELNANSVVLEWSQERGASAVKFDYPLSRIALLPEPEPRVIVSGRLGFIGLIEERGVSEEVIEGAQDEGFIRDLRVIDRHVYATGMGRQVYRRAGRGHWSRFDRGLVRSSRDYLDLTGFNAIDGLSEEDIYAVGFNGSMCNCLKGEWREIATPTNLILERVRAQRSDLVFAAGQSGILLRGYRDVWEIINQTETSNDFWGLECFRGRTYLATDEGIFRLSDHDELEKLDLGLPGPRTYSQLHASGGALWSFGARHLSWTEDGESWNDAVIH